MVRNYRVKDKGRLVFNINSLSDWVIPSRVELMRKEVP